MLKPPNVPLIEYELPHGGGIIDAVYEMLELTQQHVNNIV